MLNITPSKVAMLSAETKNARFTFHAIYHSELVATDIPTWIPVLDAINLPTSLEGDAEALDAAYEVYNRSFQVS